MKRWKMSRLVGSLALPLLILMAGCKPDAKTEARLKVMEQRQQNLREDLIALNQIVDRLTTLAKEANDANMTSMSEMQMNTKRMVNLLVDLQAEVDAVRATNEMLLGARARAMAANAPRTVAPSSSVYTQTRDGVPVAIYNQIAADAVKKWPGDFEMQAYEVKNQVGAYRKLHP